MGPRGRRLPRRACTQLPRVLGWCVHCPPGSTREGRRGQGGRGQPSPYLEPNPASRRGEKPGEEEVRGETRMSWEVS